MNNPLNFPATTVVNKSVPKNAFYGRSTDSSLREVLTREFENIVWLYKLAPSTLNVEDGERVHEIAVFHCKMKGDAYSINPFCAMDKLLPRHTLFIIEYEGKIDILMHHKEMTAAKSEQKWTCGVTELQREVSFDTLSLKIEGQSMDAVYSNILSQISGLSASNEVEYKEQAEIRKKVEQLQKQVTSLQKQVRAEKQFNRQMELNAEARRLKKEIAKFQEIINK